MEVTPTLEGAALRRASVIEIGDAVSRRPIRTWDRARACRRAVPFAARYHLRSEVSYSGPLQRAGRVFGRAALASRLWQGDEHPTAMLGCAADVDGVATAGLRMLLEVRSEVK